VDTKKRQQKKCLGGTKEKIITGTKGIFHLENQVNFFFGEGQENFFWNQTEFFG
jgi:hypothetical protein